MGGEAATHGESEIGGRNGGDRIGPWFFVIIYGERLLLLRLKMELVHACEAFYAR